MSVTDSAVLGAIFAVVLWFIVRSAVADGMRIALHEHRAAIESEKNRDHSFDPEYT